ncbi:acetyltransferase [bacterium]|nr:acetyltransferase [bacterium]
MITLRPANLADLEILKFWDQQEHVIASAPNDDWNWEEELQRTPEWRQQLIAEIDSKPIGFVQIIDPYLEETQYWGEVDQDFRAIDIWIGEQRNLNKGFGCEMMRLAIELCFADKNVKSILIDPLKSNEAAHRFYKRLGFQFVEERLFGEDECFVFRLDREHNSNLYK